MEPQAIANHESPNHPSALHQSRATAWLLALLLFLAVAPYFNTLGNGFVYDDNNEVLTNPYIRSFSHVSEIKCASILVLKISLTWEKLRI